MPDFIAFLLVLSVTIMASNIFQLFSSYLKPHCHLFSLRAVLRLFLPIKMTAAALERVLQVLQSAGADEEAVTESARKRQKKMNEMQRQVQEYIENEGSANKGQRGVENKKNTPPIRSPPGS